MRGESRATARKGLVPALFAGVGLVIALGLGEVAVRAAGLQPWRLNKKPYTVIPGDHLFRKDDVLGYTHLGGRYRIVYPDSFSFTITHLPNTLRITHPLETYGGPPKPEIWIFGCSFTHGWTVNDSETYPWHIQERFPQYEVVNFAVSGYGEVGPLLQFRQALEHRAAPRMAVLAYATFHDSRNTAGRAHRKIAARYSRIQGIVLPYARLDRRDSLVLHRAQLGYAAVPFTRVSALANLIEDRYNAWEQRRLRGQEVSRALLKTFARVAGEKGVPFVVATLDSNSIKIGMTAFLRREGIPTVDLAVRLNRPGYSNAPHDNHPSALAQRVFADKLAAYLHTLLPDTVAAAAPAHAGRPHGAARRHA